MYKQIVLGATGSNGDSAPSPAMAEASCEQGASLRVPHPRGRSARGPQPFCRPAILIHAPKVLYTFY